MKQVDVTITPYENALVGDYAVSFRTQGVKEPQDLEFRVTVKASAAWAWVGIAVIVGVVLVLMLMFRKLGRR